MPSRGFSRRADLQGIASRRKAAKLFRVVWSTVVLPPFEQNFASAEKVGFVDGVDFVISRALGLDRFCLLSCHKYF
jgi:hypothetical protein